MILELLLLFIVGMNLCCAYKVGKRIANPLGESAWTYILPHRLTGLFLAGWIAAFSLRPGLRFLMAIWSGVVVAAFLVLYALALL